MRKEYNKEEIEQVVDFLAALFDPFDGENRGTGRTRLIARAFIKIAIKHPRREVIVRDHTNHPAAHRHLLIRIQEILNDENNDYNIENWILADKMIIYRPKSRVHFDVIKNFPLL